MVTEWLDENENDVNHISWPSQAPDDPIEHLWEIVEQRMRQCFLPPSTKQQMMEFLMEEWCFASTRVPDTCRILCQGAGALKPVLAHGGQRPIKTLYVGCFLYFGSYLYFSRGSGYMIGSCYPGLSYVRI